MRGPEPTASISWGRTVNRLDDFVDFHKLWLGIPVVKE